MNKSLLIGKTNVGKTLFCIHFARYLGIREFRWLVETSTGEIRPVRMSLREAERQLSSQAPHHTLHLQSLQMTVPRGKSARQLLLTDTTGLTDGIHPDTRIREAMAKTLQAMLESNVILHIVDAAELGRLPDDSSVWAGIDGQLAEYGRGHDGYLILANKMDLPEAKQGYQKLCRRWSKHKVVPVSALRDTGFREVKQHVWRFA